MGGVGTCLCCTQTFGYFHSFSYDGDWLITSSTQDETLCPPCGGKRVDYLRGRISTRSLV